MFTAIFDMLSIISIKHAAPFRGDLNGISDGLNVNRGCLMTAIQVG
jgi:hypothetical protein